LHSDKNYASTNDIEENKKAMSASAFIYIIYIYHLFTYLLSQK